MAPEGDAPSRAPADDSASGVGTAVELERSAIRVHEAAAAAHDQVVAFAERVVQDEPDVAARSGIDPERYRQRAMDERARAERARERADRDPGEPDH